MFNVLTQISSESIRYNDTKRINFRINTNYSVLRVIQKFILHYKIRNRLLKSHWCKHVTFLVKRDDAIKVTKHEFNVGFSFPKSVFGILRRCHGRDLKRIGVNLQY